MEFRELERVRPEEIEKRSFEIITQELEIRNWIRSRNWLSNG